MTKIFMLPGKILLSFILALAILCAGNAQASCSDRVPEDIVEMLKSGEFAEAERVSRLLVEKKGDISSYYALLNVFLMQAFEKVTLVNTDGLDISPDLKEGDSLQLTEEQFKEHVELKWKYHAEFGEQAEEVMKEIAGKWPSDAKLHLCRLTFLKQSAQRKKYLEAHEEALQAIDVSDREFEQKVMELGNTFIEAGDVIMAGNIYSALASKYDKNPQILFNFATILNNTDNLKKAAEYYEKAHLADEKNPLVLDHLIEKLYYAQELEKLEKYLLKKVNSQLQAYPSYFQLALLKLPFDEEAARAHLESYNKMVEPLKDTEPEAYSLGEYLGKVLEIGVTDQGLYKMSNDFARGQNGLLAIPLLMKLVKNGESGYKPLFLMASIYEKGNHLFQAHQYTMQAAEVAARDQVDKAEQAEIMYDAGRLAYVMKQFQISREHFLEAQKLNGDLMEINYILGMLSGELRDLEAAKSYFTECAKSEPTKKAECEKYLEQL